MDAPINSLAGLFSRWELLSPWTFALLLLAGVYAAGTLRLRRRGGAGAVPTRRILYAAAAFALLFLALSGPFEALSGELLLAHMIQHMLLLTAAPLMLLASPMPSYLWGMPAVLREGFADLMAPRARTRRGLLLLTAARAALPLFVINLWLWHIPFFYNLALTSGAVHFLEHFLMFFTAVLFWWPVVGPAPLRTPLSYPKRLAFLLLAVTPTAALGALIALSNNPLYSFYEPPVGHFGLDSVEDQRIAGLLLWVPGNMLYLAAVISTFLRWADSER